MIFLKNKGFTLIELLVVIAVIGLLSSIVLVSMKGVREKARIAKAQSELDAYRQALILYEDANTYFPARNVAGCNPWGKGGEGWAVNCLNPDLAPYATFPNKDPWGSNSYYYHCPWCCPLECCFIISLGSDGVWDHGWYHNPNQVHRCGPARAVQYGLRPGSDDVVIFFGQVREHCNYNSATGQCIQ